MENRVIKFRVWDNEEKVWSSSFVIDCLKFPFNRIVSISQFTGLNDKNGKEIFEGDIVTCHYFYQALGEGFGVCEAEKEIIGNIEFKELGLWIECHDEEDSGYLLWINGLHEESFEVIGNIYENPELLNDGRD